MITKLNFNNLPSVLSPQGGTTQLHWLQEKTWCDYPSNVDCGDRPICDVDDENCVGGSVTDSPGGGGGCSDFEGECQGNEIVDEGECEQCFCQVRIVSLSFVIISGGRSNRI